MGRTRKSANEIKIKPIPHAHCEYVLACTGRHDGGRLEELVDVALAVVAHTDGLCLARLVEVLEGAPLLGTERLAAFPALTKKKKPRRHLEIEIEWQPTRFRLLTGSHDATPVKSTRRHASVMENSNTNTCLCRAARHSPTSRGSARA